MSDRELNGEILDAQQRVVRGTEVSGTGAGH
jgi:hypothetical protein